MAATFRAHPGPPGRAARSVAGVRVTSPPIALPLALAALLAPAAGPAAAVPSAAAAARWLRPVPGEVTRPFSYSRAAPFTRGAHRGADLAAAPGATVRAACAGRVLHAGRVVARHAVVTVGCGARRLTYLPLARVAVRAGRRVRAGARIGTLAAGHGGLHLGVRRAVDRWGYEDPLRFLAVASPVPSPPLLPSRPRTRDPSRTRPQTAPLPTLRPAPRFAAPQLGAGVAPWPVWAGLALVLAGTSASATVVVRRRRAASTARPVVRGGVA